MVLVDTQLRRFSVHEVLYVPDAETPILSMLKLQRRGLYTRYLFDGFKLSTLANDFCLRGEAHDDILRVAESHRFTAMVTTRRQAREAVAAPAENISLEPTSEVIVISDTEIDQEPNSNVMFRYHDAEPLSSSSTLRVSPIRVPHLTTVPRLNAFPDSTKRPRLIAPATSANNDHISVPTSKMLSSLWHRRLGHPSTSTLRKLSAIPSSFNSTECEACILAKAHRSPFPSLKEHSLIPLDLVHSDLCGPLPASLGKNIYFITFIDDYSRFSWVYLLKRRNASTITAVFNEWISLAENQSSYTVKALRTDGGGEYQRELSPLLRNQGIEHQQTTPYLPQSNGVAERLNRSLNEAVRAMLFQANMPQSWWAEAILHAVYLKNRLPHSGIRDNTPYKLWYNRFPTYKHLRPFGCIV